MPETSAKFPFSAPQSQPEPVVPMETEPCDTLLGSGHRALTHSLPFFSSSQFTPILRSTKEESDRGCDPLTWEDHFQSQGSLGICWLSFQDRKGWDLGEVQCGQRLSFPGAPGPFTSGFWLRARSHKGLTDHFSLHSGLRKKVPSSHVMKVRPGKVKGLAQGQLRERQSQF